MKKLLSLAILSILLVSCGAKTETNTKVESQKEKNEKVMKQEYKDLTKYIKGDITDEESAKLVEILEQRIERQAEIKKMIEGATKETADETYTKITEKRKICVGRILPYVAKEKEQEFKKYCERINSSIRKKLNNLK